MYIGNVNQFLNNNYKVLFLPVYYEIHLYCIILIILQMFYTTALYAGNMHIFRFRFRFSDHCFLM